MSVKVSQLPSATLVNDEDYLMIVQNGISKKATAAKVKVPLTVNNDYSTSTETPYSSNYINNHLPTNIPTIQTTTTTSNNDAYSCTYINNLVGDIETILTTITTGGGVQ